MTRLRRIEKEGTVFACLSLRPSPGRQLGWSLERANPHLVSFRGGGSSLALFPSGVLPSFKLLWPLPRRMCKTLLGCCLLLLPSLLPPLAAHHHAQLTTAHEQGSLDLISDAGKDQSPADMDSGLFFAENLPRLCRVGGREFKRAGTRSRSLALFWLTLAKRNLSKAKRYKERQAGRCHRRRQRCTSRQ